MWQKALWVVLAGVLAAGCQTTRGGMHEVPVPRHYGKLAPQDVEESAALIEHARRLGAPHTAPFAFYSAERYLDMARQQQRERDRAGTWDYAMLAKRMAEAAIGHSPGPEELDRPNVLTDLEACMAEFDRLNDRHRALDTAKAIAVAPILYAHVTAALSRAEHELDQGRHWRRAVHDLAAAAADIETLVAQDVDEDGIPDMQDGAPREPEDVDRFQDEDGVPDLDNDADGVPDDRDVAPNDPETINRWRDYDGAPDAYPTLTPVYFASGKATLSAEAKGYLRGMALIVATVPDLKLRLRGHGTDARSELDNLDLSRRRAEAVLRCLIVHGAPEGQLVVTFHGDTEPLAEGDNERVELVVE